MKTSEKDFNTHKRKLTRKLGIIDYTHVCCLFVNKTDKKMENQEQTLRDIIILHKCTINDNHMMYGC